MAKNNRKSSPPAQTNNGKKGGLLKGDPHSAPSGGIKAVVADNNNRPVTLEGGEAIINKKSVKKYWKELSAINQAEGGVPIKKPAETQEFKEGGCIMNEIPSEQFFTQLAPPPKPDMALGGVLSGWGDDKFEGGGKSKRVFMEENSHEQEEQLIYNAQFGHGD